MEPRFILLYSPQIFDPKFGSIKPEGSLGLIYLISALRDENFDVSLLDATVGNDNYSLSETFYRQEIQSDGMIRVGMQIQDILLEIKDYDVIGITSIFTAQTRIIEKVVSSIKKMYPKKLIVLGGVNARYQRKRFFNSGADLICLSEAERTIVEIGKVLRNNSEDFSDIKGLAGKNGFVNNQTDIIYNLDDLPIPAWDMQPLKKYWEIGRSHGLNKPNIAYAPIMFSRGCPFRCHFCHISKEINDSISGNIGSLRLKSAERIDLEIDILKNLGVQYLCIEDDSLLAKKKRVLDIFNRISEKNLKLGDMNGINLVHLCTNKKGKIEVDDELLEAMSHAGFKNLSFPVESGSQRIIDKYATGKLDLEKHDISALIRKATSLGMEIQGSYTFGYPDETYSEMISTFNLARKHINDGLDITNFSIITPFPGTVLYDMAIQENLLLKDPADMIIERPSMKTKVPQWFLKLLVTKGWEYVNKSSKIEEIKRMTPNNMMANNGTS